MKHIIILALLFSVTLSNSQAWCTKQYKPIKNILDDTKSPDYGKKYTVYFFCTVKADRTHFYTPLYKAELTNYDSDNLVLGRVFGPQLDKALAAYIQSKYPDMYIYASAYGGVKYCLSLEALKARYDSEIKKLKDRDKEVIITENITPSNAVFRPSTRGTSEQSVPFVILK